MAGVFAVMFAGPAAACTTVTVKAAPTLTPGTCASAGFVTAPQDSNYKWVITGDKREKTVYTATTRKSDYVLSGQVAWPFDLTKTDRLDASSPACHTGVNPVVPVVPAVPTLTAPTCTSDGSVIAPATKDYTWSITGPKHATVYAAKAVRGHAISGDYRWTFDLRKVAWDAPACQPSFAVTSDCGSVKISFVNTSPWDRFPDYRINDQAPSGVDGSGPVYTVTKVKAGQTAVIYSSSFPEDFSGGSVAVSYQDILGAGRHLDISATTVVVPTNCLADALPVNAVPQAQVTPTAPTCDSDGSLTLTNGQDYTWNDTTVLGVGTHVVTATAVAGHVFADGGPTATFTVVVLPATGKQSTNATAGCYLAPVVDLPVVAPVVVEPIVAPAHLATSTAPSAQLTPAARNRILASTGNDGLPWLLLTAAAFIGIGGLTMIRTNRARRARI